MKNGIFGNCEFGLSHLSRRRLHESWREFVTTRRALGRRANGKSLDNCTLLNRPHFIIPAQCLWSCLPMTDIPTLLLIDKNPAHAEAFREALLNAKDGPFHGEWVQTLSQSVERLREKTIWAVFASLSPPESQGLDTIDKLLQVAPGVPILVMGGAADEDLSTEALRRGAKDYLLNGHISTYSFLRAIRNMAERKTAEEVLFGEKERASVTLNSIGDAVLSTDILGNVTYLNVVAEKFTGWTCAEALGRPLGEVFHIIDGATRKPSPNPMERAIQKDKTVKLTPHCILIRCDGSEFSIED